MSKLSRRKFIITAGVTAAGTLLAHGCSSGTNTATNPAPTATPTTAGTGDTPEVTTAKLGFVALTDSAPLIIAQEKGLFAKYGMPDVVVQKQTSWAVTRDNLELGGEKGGVDGAHILSPMPYLMAAGKITKGNNPLPMYVLARLNTNGQAISVSNVYADTGVRLESQGANDAFKAKIEAAKTAGKRLKFAVTFPGGTHDLWMRYWLAAGGIDPNNDVDLIVVPPPQMVANMKTNTMDAFCVGEPWNAKLVTDKLGFSALTTGELWKDHPEKAFTMRADWVDKNPKAAKALLMAVQEAQVWCDQPGNKQEMCEILAKDKYVKTKVENILPRMMGNFDLGNGQKLENSPLMMKFWQDQASYPFKSHDLWFLTEEVRWGYLPESTDTQKLIDQVNRADLWQEAAKAIAQTDAIPKSDSRGVETFFNGVAFNPDDTTAYLNGLKIKNTKSA